MTIISLAPTLLSGSSLRVYGVAPGRVFHDPALLRGKMSSFSFAKVLGFYKRLTSHHFSPFPPHLSDTFVHILSYSTGSCDSAKIFRNNFWWRFAPKCLVGVEVVLSLWHCSVSRLYGLCRSVCPPVRWYLWSYIAVGGVRTFLSDVNLSVDRQDQSDCPTSYKQE